MFNQNRKCSYFRVHEKFHPSVDPEYCLLFHSSAMNCKECKLFRPRRPVQLEIDFDEIP